MSRTHAIPAPPTVTQTDASPAPSVGAAIEQLLRYAAGVWQLPLQDGQLERALDGVVGDDAAAHEAALQAGARAAGFEVVPFRGDLFDLLPRVHRQAPAFRMLSGGPGWVALLGKQRGKVLVGEPGRAEPRELREGEVSAMMSEAVGPWFFLEPSLPLEGAKGHDDHGHHPSPGARLVALLRPEAQDLWVVVAYAVAVGLLSLAVPVAVQALVNTVAFGVLRQPVLVLTALVLCGLLFAGAMRAAQVHVVEVLQRRLFVQAAMDVTGRLARAAPGGFDHGPELVNRFFDVLTLQKSAATLLLDGVGVVLQVAIGAIILGFYHPLLLAFDALLLVALAFIILVLGKGGVATSIEESKAKYAVVAWLQEMARANELFHGPGGRALALRRAQRLCGDYLGARREHFGVVLRQTLSVLGLHAAASAMLLGVGAVLVLERQLTLGQLVAAELIVSSMLASVSKLGKYLETAYDLLTAVDKLGHLIDIPQERTEGEEPRGRGPVELRVDGLELGHGALSFALSPRQSLAVQGPEGDLASLAALLQGHEAPGAGLLAVDGVAVGELSLDGLRSRVAVVRSCDLFDGTVLDNVRAGSAAVSAEEARTALGAVGLLGVVRALPNGLNQRLAPGGAPLTRSQATLTALARALAREPGLLVVDGALDDLTDEHASVAMDALLRPDAPWTLLLLTRKPQLAARCQRAVALGPTPPQETRP